jgi:hypothetical protein
MVIILVVLVGTASFSQGSFQRGRKSVQKGRYSRTTKKYGRACEIFEKKRVKGDKKPLLNLGFGRKRKPKMAEQE